MKNTIIFKLLALILLFTACNDFFEPDPRSQYSIMDAWKSEHNTNLYINGFYKPIYEYGPYGYTYAGVGMSDGLTDILKYNSSGMNSYGGDMNKVVFNGMISPDGNPLENYDYLYARIRRINEFLYNIDIYPKYGDEFKNRAKAQARFFRAFLYTILIRNHGKIVLRTQLDGPKEANKPLSLEKECWDFVEEDLDFAAKYLPKEWESKDDLGRLTKGAVYGFKSSGTASHLPTKVSSPQNPYSRFCLLYISPFAYNGIIISGLILEISLRFSGNSQSPRLSKFPVASNLASANTNSSAQVYIPEYDFNSIFLELSGICKFISIAGVS